METILTLFIQTLEKVGLSFLHNWPYLVLSILISVLLKLYVDPNKVGAFLIRHRKAGVVGATAAAVGTPLCSCGTTAVILGMIASMMPWAPVVAFMVASPLTSPEELVYSAGLFGWPFALMFFASSIVLGLAGGLAAGILESRGWLKNQARFTLTTPIVATPAALPETKVREPIPVLVAAPSMTPAFSMAGSPALATCGCSSSSHTSGLSLANSQPTASPVAQTACQCGSPAVPTCSCDSETDQTPTEVCSCGGPATPEKKSPVTLRLFLSETFTTTKRLVLMFAGFAFIGYFLNGLIPSAWVAAVFGKGNLFSVPLAATLGLPLYINTEGSLPLVRALIDSGMSQGAALAFLITGAGTSAGAIAGMLTIARWRVIALVIGTLWVGAIVFGYLYNALLLTGLI